jgi:SAM-dependent methyltransferase
MAHIEQQNYLTSVKNKFPSFFKGVKVLDIGSLDINGNNRYLFEDYNYTGIDIGDGPNVDIVCRGHEFQSKDKFDVVISSECFEHDEYWDNTMLNAIKLLDNGGLFVFTCATDGRAEHGTQRTSPQCSPFTSRLENDYYMNLNESLIREKIDIEKHFSVFEFQTNTIGMCDLYFYGFKK